MEFNKEEIKKIITFEIKKVNITIKELQELTKPISPDCAIGRISRMDAINNKTINENALRKTNNKLKALKIALYNIKEDNFGLCVNCTNEIPLARILIVPHSQFCVHCAS